MKRWRPAMPRYTTPVIIQRAYDGPFSKTGTQRRGAAVARVLKRLATTVTSNVEAPTGSGPETDLAQPEVFATGWYPWWPAPPTTNTNTYRIPDPPQIAITSLPDAESILPNADNPILWEASCEVATNEWSLRMQGFYARGEWIPQTGREKMEGQVQMSIDTARIKIRPEIFSLAGVNTKEWNLLRVDDGNSVWKIEALVPSFRRGEFMEVVVERMT